ncbi:MAG TPA: iron-containing redox enzyme family protein [Planctomycetota bacterium]|nr:iron-containing redox enzyme family protein [Planctomycetota bacterium]
MTDSRAPRVTEAAGRILARHRILENPYLTGLRDQSISRETFLRTQEQFFFAVEFFPRPMAALIARIPHAKARLDLLHNLVEEHGEFQEERFHASTFCKFLTSMGSKVDALPDMALRPEVRAFNSVLITACALDEWEVGVGCMGIIEQAFAGISAAIGRAVVDRGWLAKESLVHYSMHADLDWKHAEEFFAIVEGAWDDPGRRYHIEQGLELGAYAFDRLYRDLATS